ncbi:hypothetical protein [Sulfurimonas sp.]|uniref:hypothetical protein n=1 Tax=Sulfurimonas sp. TaxID=2022749 RepID=UPI002B473EB3|nr:hypothetical protein [Sulfurimonas sp.]
MSLNIILVIAVILSIGFHFIGVYANAKKTVWVMIVLMWAGAISIATNEVKPSAYIEVKKIQGQFEDTDSLIQEAGGTMSLYEFLLIKKSYIKNNPKK